MKGVFILKTKNMYHNIYAVLRIQPKYFIFLIFFFLFLGGFLFFVFFWKVPTMHTFSGVYSCNKTCTITSVVPYTISKNLNVEMKLMIQNNTYPLKISRFEQADTLSEVVAIQKITIEVPKLDYYEKQTIDFQIIEEEKSFFTVLLDALKGGEENAKE